MKRFLPFFSLAVAILLSFQLSAQGAKRYVTFEHYTNASCGPCAVQNPVFEEFYEEHKSDIRHITFHTVWPGTDPMNAHNPSEVAAMVTYHNVGGVPNMQHNGTNIGGPAGVNSDMLNVGTSPIRVNVSEVDNGDDTRTVSVEIQSVEELAAGNYILRLAAVEELITYSSPPGSNGETAFPNVFRKWIANDEALTIPTVGESTTLEFTYNMDAAWDADMIYPLAYVVNTANKEVINAGTPGNLSVEVIAGDNTLQGSSNDGNSLDVSLNNIMDIDTGVELSLEADAPADWAASFSVGGNTYDSEASLSIASGTTQATINVTPGATAGVGRYTLTTTITETGEEQKSTLTVIHGVTDLVVVNSYTAAVDILTPYTDGLAHAQNNAFADLSVGEFVRSLNANALPELNNVYLSIGWIFPALSDDLIEALEGHLDNGGNLLIAGQDIGWDVMSGHQQANGTAAQQSFYTNYLHADYQDDGSPSTNSFSINSSDEVFGHLTGSSSIANVWGGSNLYPDQIDAADDFAHEFLTYNNNGNGAVRSEKDNYKTVYIGIGLEHVANADMANELMKVSHDWFYGVVSTDEFDALVAELSLGQNMPNPANSFTNITIPADLELPARVVITDAAGKQVMVEDVVAPNSTINLNTSKLASGIYYYQLRTATASGVAKKMIVTH